MIILGSMVAYIAFCGLVIGFLKVGNMKGKLMESDT